MKSLPLLLTSLTLAMLSTLNSPHSTAFAQGVLVPPGAPMPTMKTLAQIEPRTPISVLPFTISAPGAYYLTTNLAVSTGNAIIIAANGVTLDLGGWTIASTAPSATGSGILINSGLRNLSIANGVILGGVTNNGSGTYGGSGFAYGIYYSSTAPVNVRVSGVSISGCLYHGINLNVGDATLVENCSVRAAGSYGILASTIKSSTAVDCGYTSISGDQISDCRGETTLGSYGVFGVNVQNSYGSSAAGGYGLYAYVAHNCSGLSSSGYGLYAYYSAENCLGQSTSGTGLATRCAGNCYGNSTSGTGLDCSGTAQNCYGVAGNGLGLQAYCAENCFGSGVSGLDATTAENCMGYGGAGDGVYVGLTAINCFGSTSSGRGVVAFMASFCHGTSVSGTGLAVDHNINSF